MTYKDLRDELNSLTEEQLNQEAGISLEDGTGYRIGGVHVTEEDNYYDHSDFIGNPESLKIEYGDDWENEVLDFHKVPAGRVIIWEKVGDKDETKN